MVNKGGLTALAQSRMLGLYVLIRCSVCAVRARAVDVYGAGEFLPRVAIDQGEAVPQPLSAPPQFYRLRFPSFWTWP